MKTSADQFAAWIVRQATSTPRRATLTRYLLSLGFVGSLFLIIPHTPLDGPVGGTLAVLSIVVCSWFGGFGPALLMPTLLWVISRLLEPDRPAVPSGQELMTFIALSLLTGFVGLAGRYRRRLRSTTRQHHARMREQARALSAARIIFRDLKGRITTWSQGAEELYGWRNSEAIGRPIDELLRSEFSAPREDIERQLFRDGQWRGEVLQRRKDGEPRNVVRHCILHSGEGDREPGVAEVHTDVTDLRRAEAALRESDRRKDQFVAVLAHELRNPLAPLRSGLDILRMIRPASPDENSILDTMQRQLEHLVRLVNDLLDVSRINTGKFDLQLEPALLSEILRDALAASRQQVEESDRRLTVQIPEEPLPLNADSARLVQVFTNLLHNAAKFTNAGDAIHVQAACEGGQAVVRVRDSGVGIAPESLQQIFDMFAQIEDPHCRSRDGLGLGLNVVRTIVEMHGGTVAASSDGPGRGAEFVVRLPVLQDPARSGEDGGGEASSTNGDAPSQRVLVVDDNQDAARMLSLMLSTAGFESRSVFDGPSAITAAAEFDPHAVVLDLGMPGMNGLEVARHLRRDNRYEPLLLIAATGWDKEEDRRLTREAGFDYHFAKPVPFDRLRELIGAIGTATPGPESANPRPIGC
jgi:PAS domain S-box-containing protein